MSQAGSPQSRLRLLLVAVAALLLVVVGALRLWGPYAPRRPAPPSVITPPSAPQAASPSATPTGRTGQPIIAHTETAAMPHSGDAADDAAVWVHPADPSRSTVIATDKRGGLAVYDLAGQQLHYHAGMEPNNVDLRYNFPLAGERVTLVTTSDRSNDTLRVYTVDPATRDLRDVAARRIATGSSVYGLCMYHSARTGMYSVFVTDEDGAVEQWELFDQGGKVDARKVRTLTIGSRSEGCAADDELGVLYVGEEDVGLWRYGAEPAAGEARTQIDATKRGGGNLKGDVEGVTIYHTSNGGGYLIVSSQGSDDFAVYERGGKNRYLTRFSIAPGEIDAVSETDGIDVTSFDLGGAFSEGLFVAQDGDNDSGNQNFKLVPWGAIARSFGSPLTIDTGWDPRALSRVK